MSDARRGLGAEGEARAAALLVQSGYRILDRNVRCGGVEIDIVAARGDLVAFVEVKTRSSRALGPPEAAVDGRKRARLVRAAAAWLRAHPGRARHARFDVVACERTPQGGWRLRHLRAAFDAGDGR